MRTAKAANKIIKKYRKYRNNPKKKEQLDNKFEQLKARIPNYAKDDFVITIRLRDYCPQCYKTLNAREMCEFKGLFIIRCTECLLYVCFDLNHEKAH